MNAVAAVGPSRTAKRGRTMTRSVAVGRTLVKQGRPPGGCGPFKMAVDVGAGAESRIGGLRNCRHVAVRSGQRGVVDVRCDVDPAIPVLGSEAAASGVAFGARRGGFLFSHMGTVISGKAPSRVIPEGVIERA